MGTNVDSGGTAGAVGRIPSGMAILTAAHGERSTGMLASWIQQASFDPLTVSVCVKRGRPIEQLIDASARFVLNIVGTDTPELFKHFGKGFAPNEPAFDGVATRTHEAGVVLDSAIVHIACSVSAKVEAGDHHLYLGEVLAGDGDTEAAPFVHLRKTGLSY